MSTFFTVRDLQVSAGSTEILPGLDLELREGEVTALLGHNGSGKSTLLKVLARQWQPDAGAVDLLGRPSEQASAREFARVVGYLPQHPGGTDGLTIEELVLLGRYPWRGALARYTPEDHRIVRQAIADTDLDELRKRPVDALSGGERQRAWIAMLLAQQTRCLLLDEPISALDVRHQVETLSLIRRLAVERELTVVVVLHDVDLAARFCDRMVALKNGRIIADGAPGQIMDEQTLQRIYSIPMGVIEREAGRWISYAC